MYKFDRRETQLWNGNGSVINSNFKKAFTTVAKTFCQCFVFAKPALVFTVSATEAGQITEHKDWRIASRV